MSSRFLVTAWTTALTAALVTASLAQGPRVASPHWQDARAAAVRRLEVGQAIRVERQATERFTGIFLGTSGTMLLLDHDSAERSLLITDMTGLWVRGSAWQTGSLVGGVLLAGIFATAGGSYCGELDSPPPCALLLGAVVFWSAGSLAPLSVR